MHKLSFDLTKISREILGYAKKCPEYKGKGWCVYPHKPGTKVGPGTGWPKKPSPPATKARAEQLAKNLASHGGSGGYEDEDIYYGMPPESEMGEKLEFGKIENSFISNFKKVLREAYMKAWTDKPGEWTKKGPERKAKEIWENFPRDSFLRNTVNFLGNLNILTFVSDIIKYHMLGTLEENRPGDWNLKVITFLESILMDPNKADKPGIFKVEKYGGAGEVFFVTLEKEILDFLYKEALPALNKKIERTANLK